MNIHNQRMKKIIFIIIFIGISILLFPRNIISYNIDKYDAVIYYPEDYEILNSEHVVVFYNDEKGAAFSLFYSESKNTPVEQVRSLEESYNAVNLLDSTNIYLTPEEINVFNIDNGLRSYFKYAEDDIMINILMLVRKKDSVLFLIMTQFSGEVSKEERMIIDDCITTFRIKENE